MRAFVANAEWDPRSGANITPREESTKRADSGSWVWRNPIFELTDVPVPEVGDNEVLVRVNSCGICGSDSHLYETDSEGYIIFSGPVKLPSIIGHEYSGVVEEVGKNVINFKRGDRVAAESIVWCGKCTSCRSGAFNQCRNLELAGITVDGAFAEYTKVNELQCWKIDSLVDHYEDDGFDLGALIEPIGCAYNGMFVRSRVFKPGVVAVVHGAGPIGLGAVALARLAGASLIIAFDKIPERLQIAKIMGADYVYNTNELGAVGVRPHDIVMEHTRGRGAEMQIEAAGAANATIPEMENSLAVNGNIVYLGRAAIHAPILLNSLVSGGNAIVGSRGHAGYGIYDNIIKLLASGRLQVKDMITTVTNFDNVLEALEQSVKRTDGKIMVRM